MISPSGFERHPDLYFADGDVVLAVKQTPKSEDEEAQPKYQLFRVHKFMLKLHSPAFSNFFADADATPAEVYDGVSLAEMHGDKAEDFALLLSYLYKPSSFVFKRQSPHTPGIVSGVIRLADKYLMESLHRRLVQQVCDDWPTTLDDYDIDQAAIDVLEALPGRSVQDRIYPCGSARYPGEFVPEPTSAIHFAREFGCPQILPAAFYRLSLTPAADYYEAFGFPQSHWPPTELARLATLDKETLLGYIHGCQMLAGYRPPVTRFMCNDCAEEWNLEQGPPLHSPCYQYITRLFVLTRPGGSGPDKLGDRSQVHGDPLRWLWRCFDHYKMPELAQEHLPRGRGLCEECEAGFGLRLAEERKRIWDRLRAWFHIT